MAKASPFKKTGTKRDFPAGSKNKATRNWIFKNGNLPTRSKIKVTNVVEFENDNSPARSK